MPSRLGEMAWHASVFSIKVATMCNCHGTVPFRPGEAPGVVYVNVHAYQLLSLNRANPLQSSYGRARTERNQTKYLSSLVHHTSHGNRTLDMVSGEYTRHHSFSCSDTRLIGRGLISY
jgi:hypothetical protein